MKGSMSGVGRFSTGRGINEEICSTTMLMVKSRFLCRIVLVYPITCASDMEDCGWSKLWGMDKLNCGASVDRTSLFTMILCKKGRMDGSWFMNSWSSLSFWIRAQSGAGNDCKYGCVVVSGAVEVAVGMTSSTIWVRDGGGGV